MGTGRGGSHLLGAGRQAELPYVRAGQRVFLQGEDDHWYLDGSSGALAANLGHGREDMAEAMRAQARTVAFAHRTQLRNRPAEQLAELIATWAPGDLSQCMFVSSGSDANELALAIAMRYWSAHGAPQRNVMVARDRSYHGATIGSLSLTGLAERRVAMSSLLLDVARLPSPPPDTDQAAVAELVTEVQRLFAVRAGTLAAVVVEVVSGTAGGAIVSPPEYLAAIQTLCRETGTLLIVDEVMSGFGRTGRAFASAHADLQPDILTFGKGVRGGTRRSPGSWSDRAWPRPSPISVAPGSATHTWTCRSAARSGSSPRVRC